VDQNDDGTINFSDELAAAQDGPYSYTDTAAGPIWIGTSTTEGVASGHTLVSLSPRDFYYSSQWQVIQETANNSGTGAMQTADQYVWGIAYVNELVLRDADSDGSSSTGSYGNAGSGLDQRLYALQDANYNVTALVGLVSGSWTVVERFEYTPYGTMTVLNASGAQTTDSFNWLYGFQGGRRDAVTGLISFQNRNYDPTTGTWMTQDPDGYVNGASLYQFVASNPIDNSDPSGLAAEANPQPVPEPPQGPNGPGGPIGLPPGHSWAPNPPPKPGRRQGYHPVPPVRGLPSGSQPGISWNGTPPGSWGLDDGKKGPRQHFDPDGNPLAPDEAHPFIPPIDIPHIDPITERKLIHNTCAAGLSGTIIIIIIIIGAPVGA
jgi:RHS repeat-associated protein